MGKPETKKTATFLYHTMVSKKLDLMASRCYLMAWPFFSKIGIVIVFLLLPLLIFAQSVSPKTKQQALSKKAEWAKMAAIKLATGPQDSVVRIKNLRTQLDSAKINEVIAIKVFTQRDIRLFNTLYINGFPIENLTPLKASDSEKIIYFRLGKPVQSQLLSFLESTPFETTVVPVYFGVGANVKVNLTVKDTTVVKDPLTAVAKTVIKDTTVQVERGIIAKSNDPVYVEVKQKIKIGWVYAAALAVTFIIVLGLFNQMLKDNANLYYSLANTQLFFWTVLFVVAYLSICFKTDTLPDIPLSVLAILGISVSTTAVSKLIDKNPAKAPIIDKNATSQGLFVDILSDGVSINVQRVQNVAFNAFFGVLFLQKAFSTNLLPDFDNNVLLLLGISAGAYAGLKNTEPAKEQTEEPVDTLGERGEIAKEADKAQAVRQENTDNAAVTVADPTAAGSPTDKAAPSP
jgi:hypothetical protein